MAAITERNGQFTARVRKQGFKTVSKTFSKKADPIKWAMGLTVSIENGTYQEPSAQIPTLAAAIAEYQRTAGAKLSLREMTKGAKAPFFVDDGRFVPGTAR